ncbi:DUF2066 domain-containing protein [Litoribrevibacter euphylliae]|uniref:DUF2066 domain-containing protein n=1 Tax=Litoribrevibacter euphylliae TaxID=1834034 RepID=A0ABV7HBS6_9GAMM
MYKIYKVFLVFLCAFCASFSTVFAQDLGSQAVIRKVVSQQQSEFKVAVRSAFVEYLTMMSGNSAVSELPQVAQLMAQPDKFLLEFRYEPLAESDLEIVSEFEQSKQAKWRLRLRFDHKAVESALFNAGAPIWPMPRPDLMVWVAYESQDGLRRVLTSNEVTPEKYKSSLTYQARGRGINLKFPVYDDEDRELLSTSALWGLFQEEIKQASLAYQLKNSLAARIFPSSEETWQFDAVMNMPNASVPYQGTAESEAQALSLVLNNAMNIMAEHYALQVDPNDQREVLLDVASVSKYDQLHYMMADLSSILMVKDVIPVSLNGNDVQLKLKILGDEQLLQVVLSNKDYLLELIKVDDQVPDVSTEPVPADNVAVGEVETESEIKSEQIVNLYYQYQSEQLHLKEQDGAEVYNASDAQFLDGESSDSEAAEEIPSEGESEFLIEG